MDPNNAPKQCIMVLVKNVYGKRLVYPDCSLSNLFCRIGKKRTLTGIDIELIKEEGFRVKVRSSEEYL